MAIFVTLSDHEVIVLDIAVRVMAVIDAKYHVEHRCCPRDCFMLLIC